MRTLHALLALTTLLATGSGAAQPPDELETALVHDGEQARGQGNFAAADVKFKLEQQVAERNHQPARVAEALRNLGLDARLQQRYSEALDDFRASRAIGEQLGDQSLIARAENGIGATAAQAGDFDTSLAAFNHARQIAQSSGDRGQLGRILANLGTVAQLQGDLAAARDYTKQSLQIERAEKFADSDIATLYLNLGVIAANQGDNARALASYQDSLRLLGDSDSTQQAILLNDIAMIYRSEGQYDQTAGYARRALALSERIGNREEIASAYGALASASVDQSRLLDGLRAYQKSVAIYQDIGNKRDAAYTLSAMGEVLARLRRYDQAEQVFAQARDIGRSLHLQAITGQSLVGMARMRYQQHRYKEALLLAEESADLLDRAEYRASLWLARTAAGQSWLALGKRAQARQAFEDAIANIEELRNRVAGGHESRTGFFSGALTPYHGMIDLLVAEHRPREALQYAERAKGRTLLDILTTGTANLAGLKARPGQITPVSDSELTSIQPDSRAAMLEYVLTEEHVYLFVVTHPAHVHVYTLNSPRSALDSHVREFRDKLAARNLDVRGSSSDLFQRLLSSAWPDIKDKTGLLIVPDGLLWEVPFQALLADSGRYLIEDHTLSYAPSLSVLREMQRLHAARPHEPASTEHTLLVLADPDLGNTTQPPLPEARREAEALRTLYGPAASIYLGASARESVFKSEAGRFRVLHLATHGLLDDSHPLYSNLRLAPDADGKEDGRLEAHEIMQMSLHADLAVLSACETGRGRISAGEGVIGLAWGFFVAGTPATVVSLWNVESVNTADLMLEFHRRLHAALLSGDDTLPTAQALREAQLHLLHASPTAHPFYWAGFSAVGVTR